MSTPSIESMFNRCFQEKNEQSRGTAAKQTGLFGNLSQYEGGERGFPIPKILFILKIALKSLFLFLHKSTANFFLNEGFPKRGGRHLAKIPKQSQFLEAFLKLQCEHV